MRKYVRILIMSLAFVAVLSSTVMAFGTWNRGVSFFASSGTYQGYSNYVSGQWHSAYAALDGYSSTGWVQASPGRYANSYSSLVHSYSKATLLAQDNY